MDAPREIAELVLQFGLSQQPRILERAGKEIAEHRQRFERVGGALRVIDADDEQSEAPPSAADGNQDGGVRVETRGEGPDTPIASNTTKLGRQQNRRIEFQIIK